MKFENTEVYGLKSALRGMRNPMNSWDKSDSKSVYSVMINDKDNLDFNHYLIGKNDMELAQKLIRAGSEHRKFMRQIFISVDITAPLYWWKEFDTYKVGTVANSTSTMHKLATTEITLDCFETDDITKDLLWDTQSECDVENNFIPYLENLRIKYLNTQDKRYWKELIRWLPESWLQKRTVTMSYENLLVMCNKGQRRYHKLNEWSGQDDNTKTNFISWARTLPYAQELIFIDEIEEISK